MSLNDFETLPSRQKSVSKITKLMISTIKIPRLVNFLESECVKPDAIKFFGKKSANSCYFEVFGKSAVFDTMEPYSNNMRMGKQREKLIFRN